MQWESKFQIIDHYRQISQFMVWMPQHAEHLQCILFLLSFLVVLYTSPPLTASLRQLKMRECSVSTKGFYQSGSEWPHGL